MLPADATAVTTAVVGISVGASDGVGLGTGVGVALGSTREEAVGTGVGVEAAIGSVVGGVNVAGVCVGTDPRGGTKVEVWVEARVDMGVAGTGGWVTSAPHAAATAEEAATDKITMPEANAESRFTDTFSLRLRITPI